MRNERPEYPPVLTGIAEAENVRRGLRSEAPRLIGDASKAEEVMRGGTSKPLIGFSTASTPLIEAAKPLRVVDARSAA